MKVQVGLPVKNGERFLERALKSLLSQSYSNFEILVSDNASTDRSLDIALSFAAVDPRVRVVTGDRGGGLENFAFLLEQCSAPIFMWAAHDDYWEPDFISSGAAAIQSGQDFFIPKWWYGDIDEGVGWSPKSHPLSFVSQIEPYKRVVQYVNLGQIGKDNVVYSVFRTEILQETFQEFCSTVRFPATAMFGGLFGALICARMKGVVSDEIMFWKQSAWHANRAPQRTTISPTPRIQDKRTLLRRIFSLLRNDRHSLTFTADGMAQLVINFPELAGTFCRIFTMQNTEKGAYHLVEDSEGLLAQALAEVTSWPQKSKLR